MRQMISYPSQGPVRQFRCTDCEWAFHVQQPITPEVDLELQHSYATRWYETHHSVGLPTSKCRVFRNDFQPSATGSGAEG
jgi:hypothetical protein